jgi:hypothetical protein
MIVRRIRVRLIIKMEGGSSVDLDPPMIVSSLDRTRGKGRKESDGRRWKTILYAMEASHQYDQLTMTNDNQQQQIETEQG